MLRSPPSYGNPLPKSLPRRDQRGAPTMTPHTRTVRPAGSGRAPLPAVLAFGWISSLGTGIATNGIYFLSKEHYHFTVSQNYWLGLLAGVMYIFGALGAGPLIRRARQMGVSTRGVLIAVVLLLGLLCQVPILAASGAERPASQWPIWLLVALYQPLTGVMWPVVESFLSGGRSGAELRSALGRFNVTWSSALVVALCAMGPMEKFPTQLLAALGIVHLVSLLTVSSIGAEPGRHLADEHEPHPPVYTRLLVTFRILLPVSYMVLTALTPYLPAALASLGIAAAWRPPASATWTAARLVTFFALERWHGWHGRWSPAAVGVVLLLGGFAAAVLAPMLGPSLPGMAMMLSGLAAFGVGMSTIYTAALYYAMEVEKAEVDAGGMHEALIGLGYTGGPACGLAGVGMVATQVVGVDSGPVVTLTMVGVIALTVVGGTGYSLSRSKGRRAPKP